MSIFFNESDLIDDNIDNGDIMNDDIDNIVLTPEDENLLEEMFLVDECSHFNDDQMKMFLESDLLQSLEEAGKFRKRTIVRLSGKADLNRRTTLAAIYLAKKNKDPLWAKLAKNRVMERKLLRQIKQKYGLKGSKVAKKTQKDYIKNRMPKSFMSAGGMFR